MGNSICCMKKTSCDQIVNIQPFIAEDPIQKNVSENQLKFNSPQSHHIPLKLDFQYHSVNDNHILLECDDHLKITPSHLNYKRISSLSISLSISPIPEVKRCSSFSKYQENIVQMEINAILFLNKKPYKKLPKQNHKREKSMILSAKSIKKIMKTFHREHNSMKGKLSTKNFKTPYKTNNCNKNSAIDINLPIEKGSKLHHLPIEKIEEPLNEKQLNLLKGILCKVELIYDEMDEDTINKIIQTISYIRVKPNVVIFKRENTSDNIYYIIDKGKMEYQIDEQTYELTKHNGIGTRALIKNSKMNCILKSVERCYLFTIPIEKYKIISQEFMDNQIKQKFDCLKRHFFFRNFDKDFFNKIMKISIKEKYKKKTELIIESSLSHCFYLIMEGKVECSKGKNIIKTLFPGEIFGDIGLFMEVESFYTYTVEMNSILLRIEYTSFLEAFGEKAIKHLIYTIFESAIKQNEILSKCFLPQSMDKLFSVFHLKFYFNDTVASPKDKKIFIPISGSILKTKNQNQNIKGAYKTINFDDKENLIQKGNLHMELVGLPDIDYHILGDEVVVFEALWEKIEKLISPMTNSDYTISEQIHLIKYHPLFKELSALQLFEISMSMKVKKFPQGQIILKDGPKSDAFYIIKHGVVNVRISNVVVKSLDKHQTFGDISSHFGDYSRKADFVAFGKVECFIIEKEIYDEISDKVNQVLQPINKLIVMNDLTISLENLYYIKEIGAGAFGKVYLVHDKKCFYAMKTAELQSLNQKKNIFHLYLAEKTIMTSIYHPFIVQLHNTFKTKAYLFFLLEFIDGISLRSFITEGLNGNIKPLRNQQEVQFYGAILFSVLYYFHKNRIIHRDLKPDNILIDKTGYLKVIDFGIAKKLTIKDYTTSFIGTPHYMSPEVIAGKNYSFGIDYWAVGVILYEIYYGRVPFGFGVQSPNQIYQEITEKKPHLPSDTANNSFNSLIKMLLQKNPSKRLSNFQKVKALPLYNEYNFDLLLKMKLIPPNKPEGMVKNEDLNNIDMPFLHFMRNHVYFSSKELNILLKSEQVFDGEF